MKDKMRSSKEFRNMMFMAWALIVGVNVCLIGAARLSYEMFFVSYGRFVFIDFTSSLPSWLGFRINVAHTFAFGMFAVQAACLHLIQSSLFGAINRKFLTRFEARIGMRAGAEQTTERVERIESEIDAGTKVPAPAAKEEGGKSEAYNLNFNRSVCAFSFAVYVLLALVSYFQAQRISLEQRSSGFDEMVAGDETHRKFARKYEDARENLAAARKGSRDTTLSSLLRETEGHAVWSRENRQKTNAGIANKRLSTIAENLRLKDENISYWSGEVSKAFAEMDARRKEMEKNFSVVEGFANAVGPGLLEVLAFGGAIALSILNCFRRGTMLIFPVRPRTMGWKARRRKLRGASGKAERKSEEQDRDKVKREPRRKPGSPRSLEEIEEEIDGVIAGGDDHSIDDVVSPHYREKTASTGREKIEPIPADFKAIFDEAETIEEFLEWLMISIPCPTKKVLSKAEAWIMLRGLAFCRFKGDQGEVGKHKDMDRNRAHRYYNQGLKEAVYYRKYGYLDSWIEAMNQRLHKLGVPVIRQSQMRAKIEFPQAIIKRGMSRPFGSVKLDPSIDDTPKLDPEIAEEAKRLLLLATNPVPIETDGTNGQDKE